MIVPFFENAIPLVRLTKLYMVQPHRNKNALLLSRAGFCPHNHYVAVTPNRIIYPLTTNRIVYRYVRAHVLTPYALNGDVTKAQYIVPIGHRFEDDEYHLEESELANDYYEENQELIEDKIKQIQTLYPNFILEDFKSFAMNHTDMHRIINQNMHVRDRIR